MTAQHGGGSSGAGGRKAQKTPAGDKPEKTPAGRHEEPAPAVEEEKPTPAVEVEKPAPADGHNQGRKIQMIKRAPIWLWVIAALVAAAAVSLPFALASFGGGESEDVDGDDAVKAAKPEQPVEGSFVGKVSGMKAFVAVVAEPGAAGQEDRAVEIYITDGTRISESFSGSIADNSFTAESEDGDAEAKGELSGESVTGTVELPNGKTVRYKANRPAGAAGLYDLSVSVSGRISGASAGGIGVKGRVDLVEESGVLRLADGRRLRFDVSEDPGDLQVGAGQVLLIVLENGEARGAGMSPAEDNSAFFVRSAS